MHSCNAPVDDVAKKGNADTSLNDASGSRADHGADRACDLDAHEASEADEEAKDTLIKQSAVSERRSTIDPCEPLTVTALPQRKRRRSSTLVQVRRISGPSAHKSEIGSMTTAERRFEYQASAMVEPSTTFSESLMTTA